MVQFIATSFMEDPKGALILRLNDQEVLIGKGKIKLDLNQSTKYYATWFVRGKYRSTYSISISSPAEAQIQITRVIGKSEVDFRFLEFHT